MKEGYRIAKRKNFFYTHQNYDFQDAMEKGHAVFSTPDLTDKMDPNCQVVTIGALNTVLQAFPMRKVLCKSERNDL